MRINSVSEMAKGVGKVTRVPMTGRARVAIQGPGYRMPLGNGTKISTYIAEDRTKKIIQNNLSKFINANADRIKTANAVNTSSKAAKNIAGDALEWLSKNKIPQIAAGIGITAFLVNKLSSRRGRQTNAELYSQDRY